MDKLPSHVKKSDVVRLSNLLVDFFLVVVVYLFGQFALVTYIRSFGVTTNEDLAGRPGVLTGAYIIGGLFVLLGTYVAIRYRKMTFKDIWLQRPKLSDIGYGILGFGAYFLVARIIFVFVGVFIPSINLNESQEIGLKNIDSGLLPLVFLALAVLPPLSEEILFRGFFLQRLLKNKVMAVLAGLLVSVTFGVMHRQWNVGIDTFVLSMVMIYTLSLRKSLWVTITMHIIKNTLAFLALFVFKIV